MLPKGEQDLESLGIDEGTWNRESIRFRSNRVIVKFRPIAEDSSETVESLCDDVASAIPGGTLIRPPRATGRAIFAVESGASIPRLAHELSNRDDVEYAEPDVVDSAAAIPNDPRYSDQWALPNVNAPAAWDLETGSSTNVLIGIIDSGISLSATDALDHPDLNHPLRYVLGTDFVDGGTPRDLNGHGTHVAGIAAAETNNSAGIAGLNWNSPVYVCRTLDTAGNGGSADFADAVEEIVDFALAHGMRAVINYSAGGAANQTKEDACRYANDNGMILCAATGNDNAGPVIFPAAYSLQFDGVIAVGSIDSDNTVSSFSNVGPEVTVVAPGRNILSTMPTYSVTIPGSLNYDRLDGTSMATPHVTALAALMWSRHPGFTNRRIRDCITSTAIPLTAGATFDNTWGFGRIEAEEALRCGDPVFTHFTLFTHFTFFTPFTRFTPLTRFTFFTPFTPLTRFTFFTPFTRFTPLTRFTRFTPFTPFQTFDGPIDVEPLIRVGNMTYSLNELRIENFEELDEVRAQLESVGIKYLHELVLADPEALSATFEVERRVAEDLLALSQRLLDTLG